MSNPPTRAVLWRRFRRAFMVIDGEYTTTAFLRSRKTAASRIRKGTYPYCPVWVELSQSGFEDYEVLRLSWVGYESSNVLVIAIVSPKSSVETQRLLSGTQTVQLFGLQTIDRCWSPAGRSLGIIGLPSRVNLSNEIDLARYWLGEE